YGLKSYPCRVRRSLRYGRLSKRTGPGSSSFHRINSSDKPAAFRAHPSTVPPTLMLYVSILIELLRSRPAAAVCLAALAQGLLWTIVPSLFSAGPPGALPVAPAI